MRRILGLAVSLGLLASATANKANEESPEATLTRIEKDFAETQITKDTKAVEPAMADDFYSFDPATGSRRSKAELIASIKPSEYVITSMSFPPFLIRVFGSTAIAQGTNDAVGMAKGKPFKVNFVWFDVFEKRNGHWVWIVSESSQENIKITTKNMCDKPYCAANQPGFSVKQ